MRLPYFLVFFLLSNRFLYWWIECVDAECRRAYQIPTMIRGLRNIVFSECGPAMCLVVQVEYKLIMKKQNSLPARIRIGYLLLFEVILSRIIMLSKYMYHSFARNLHEGPW